MALPTSKEILKEIAKADVNDMAQLAAKLKISPSLLEGKLRILEEKGFLELSQESSVDSCAPTACKHCSIGCKTLSNLVKKIHTLTITKKGREFLNG